MREMAELHFATLQNSQDLEIQKYFNSTQFPNPQLLKLQTQLLLDAEGLTALAVRIPSVEVKFE